MNIREPNPAEINEVRNFCKYHNLNPYKPSFLIPYSGVKYELRAWSNDYEIIRFNFFTIKNKKVVALCIDEKLNNGKYWYSHELIEYKAPIELYLKLLKTWGDK